MAPGLTLQSTVTLANGVEMPRFGLGTYKARGEDVEQSVLTALELGYRSIDTASMYENEEVIGRALREGGVPREDVFLTTKVWNDEQGFAETQRALARSLRRLGTDYIDLYLVHWPVREHFYETWQAMESLLAEGHARAIGVCNFLVPHLELLAEKADVMPMVDQYEFHPYLQQPGLHAYCDENGIAVEAWAPIMRGRVDAVEALVEIGERHSKSPAQVSLRWLLQRGAIVIPKSVHAGRIRENAELFDFELSDAEMAAIDALDRGERLGRDPMTMAW